MKATNRGKDQSRADATQSDDLRCVWMTAGVLTYWLCPRDYACEECPLNRLLQGKAPDFAVQGGRRSGEDVLESAGCALFEHLRVPLRRRRGLHYHPTHVWGREVGPGRVQLGLDDMAARLTRGAEGWVLPTLGETLGVGDSIGRSRTLDTAFEVASPLAGRVVTRNEALRTNPTLAIWSPYDAGWLVEVDTSARLSPRTGFLHAEVDVASWLAAELEWLAGLSSSRASPDAQAVGATGADGGTPLASLQEALGEEGSRAALRGLFPWRSSVAGD